MEAFIETERRFSTFPIRAFTVRTNSSAGDFYSSLYSWFYLFTLPLNVPFLLQKM